MRRLALDFTPRLRPSATARPQPALEQLSPRADGLRQHAGIGVRTSEPRLEAHQLVAAKSVYPDALSRAVFGQGRVEARPPGPQALHRDDQVAGGNARFLSGAAFEHVGDGGVLALRPRANAEQREPRGAFRARRSAALVLTRLGRTQFHFHSLGGK